MTIGCSVRGFLLIVKDVSFSREAQPSAMALPDQNIDSAAEVSPLEQFLRDNIEAGGGAWEQVEPQVYDLLLPQQAQAPAANDGESSLVRVTFDPEALAEHPRAQLASLGTPLIDKLVASALERGRFVELHFLGLNLQPYQLAAKVSRAIKLAEGLTLDIQRLRAVDFPQLVFWFEVAFISDQREQEVLPLAVDLYHGRQVRHLDLLLDETRLSEAPSVVLPEAPGVGRSAAYKIARAQVLRSVASLANVRARDLNRQLDIQVARMTRYFDDLQQELEAQAKRGRDEVSAEKFESRRGALAHERESRIAELRRKSTLRAQLRLLITLVVHQPKLQILAAVVDTKARSGQPNAEGMSLRLIWDPLAEALEAIPCQVCRRPTFELASRAALLMCPACFASAPSPRRIHR